MYPLLLLLTLVPSISAIVDCRTACRTCRENTEPPETLEVYCAMCEECKERRRERLRGKVKLIERTEDKVEKVENVERRPRCRAGCPGYMPLMPPILAPMPMIPGIPAGCPMPPPCESSEEEVTTKQTVKLLNEETITTTATTMTTTTTTTTTKRPSARPRCPAIPRCRKKLRYAPPPVVPVFQSIINVPMMPWMPMNVMRGLLPPLPISDEVAITEIQSSATEPTTTSAGGTTTQVLTCPLMTSSSPSPVKMKNVASSTHNDFEYIYIGIPKDSKNK